MHVGQADSLCPFPQTDVFIAVIGVFPMPMHAWISEQEVLNPNPTQKPDATEPQQLALGVAGTSISPNHFESKEQEQIRRFEQPNYIKIEDELETEIEPTIRMSCGTSNPSELKQVEFGFVGTCTSPLHYASSEHEPAKRFAIRNKIETADELETETEPLVRMPCGASNPDPQKQDASELRRTEISEAGASIGLNPSHDSYERSESNKTVATPNEKAGETAAGPSEALQDSKLTQAASQSSNLPLQARNDVKESQADGDGESFENEFDIVEDPEKVAIRRVGFVFLAYNVEYW